MQKVEFCATGEKEYWQLYCLSGPSLIFSPCRNVSYELSRFTLDFHPMLEILQSSRFQGSLELKSGTSTKLHSLLSVVAFIKASLPLYPR